MNVFAGVGNIARIDDDVQILGSGTNSYEKIRFSIALNKDYKHPDDSPDADFFNCEAWGKTAELLSTYVHKGQQVGLFGNLQQEKWEKDGKKYSKLIVSVQDITFIVNEKKTSQDEPQAKREPSPYDVECNPFYEPEESFDVLPDGEGCPF